MANDTFTAADQRRTEIAEKSATLFNEHGFDRVSMDDIARAVGLAKPSLYHYFRSKEEVLFMVHSTLFESMMSKMESRLAATSSAKEQLLGVFQDIFESLDSHPGYSRVFFESMRRLDTDNYEQIRANQHRYEDRVRQILARGIEEKWLAPLDTRLASLAVFGMCYWSYQWYSPGGGKSPRELADTFFTYFVDGVGA